MSERIDYLDGRFKPRPIIAKFSFYKDRGKILTAYREKGKQLVRPENSEVNQTNKNESQDDNATDKTKRLRVSEDFPERVSN